MRNTLKFLNRSYPLEFRLNPHLSAGYYTEDDQLVYSVSIDCGASTWTSTVSNQESGEPTTFETGSVVCGGEAWDLWLKVEQPYLMNWIFNGTALQVGTRYIESRHRLRPLKVPTKYGSHKAKTLKISTSTSTPITRFTFGECISYPEGLGCRDAERWVFARSKVATKLSVLGADITQWKPICVRGTDYFWHVQTNIHPTRKSNHNIICCVDMVTGIVPDNDPEKYCMVASRSTDILDLCEPWYQSDLYEEGGGDEGTVFSNYYSTGN